MKNQDEMVKVDYSFGAPMVLAIAELNIPREDKMVSECEQSFWSGKGTCMCNSHSSAKWETRIPKWLADEIQKDQRLNEENPFDVEGKKQIVVHQLKKLMPE